MLRAPSFHVGAHEQKPNCRMTLKERFRRLESTLCHPELGGFCVQRVRRAVAVDVSGADQLLLANTRRRAVAERCKVKFRGVAVSYVYVYTCKRAPRRVETER